MIRELHVYGNVETIKGITEDEKKITEDKSLRTTEDKSLRTTEDKSLRITEDEKVQHK